jgi:quercetin dioxygenase-like cupin family protein
VSARARAVAAALLGAALAAGAVPPPAGTLQVQPEAIEWRTGNPSMPAGTQVAVLEGDPKAAGLFTIRLKVPAGARLAPHWHPRDERVTVMSGLVLVGFGDAIDEAATRRFGAGAFYVNPARSHHFVLFRQDSIVQVTGVGPWEVHFLEAPAAPKR